MYESFWPGTEGRPFSFFSRSRLQEVLIIKIAGVLGVARNS